MPSRSASLPVEIFRQVIPGNRPNILIDDLGKGLVSYLITEKRNHQERRISLILNRLEGR